MRQTQAQPLTPPPAAAQHSFTPEDLHAMDLKATEDSSIATIGF